MSKFCNVFVVVLAFTSAMGADRYHADRGADPIFDYEKNTEDIAHWKKYGTDEIHAAINEYQNLNTNKAKNVILFIGDGMSLETLTAARIYKAQQYDIDCANTNTDHECYGEETLLDFEKFPHTGFSKTYCIDQQTTDSAASASAMLTGVKTTHYTLGYDHKIINKNLDSIKNATKVDSMALHAQKAGKDTGFVTTTRVTHATPASTYSHSASRDWECYKDLDEPRETDVVTDIAYQLIHNEPGNKMKVMMGGGRPAFFLKKEEEQPETKDSGYDSYTWDCYSNETLVDIFLNESTKNVYVENRTELMEVDVTQVDRLFGLFGEHHLLFDHERRNSSGCEPCQKWPDQPSLTEMTQKAIEMLQKNTEHGFFLLVEGGRIDHAHHDTYATTALDETVAFDMAIKKATTMVDLQETLIIVTADHGHTMTIGGYQSRGADIRGLVDNEDANDDKPYMIMTYGQGPGYGVHLNAIQNTEGELEVDRLDLTDLKENYTRFNFIYPTGIPKDSGSETHSGADVGIFAQGPFSHLFHGVHENIYIYHVMTYSACLDQYTDAPHCSTNRNSASKFSPMFGVMFAIMLAFV